MLLYRFNLNNGTHVIFEAENIIHAWQTFFFVFGERYTEENVQNVKLIQVVED